MDFLLKFKPLLYLACWTGAVCSASANSEWWTPYDGLSSNTLALYRFDPDGGYTNGGNAYSSVIPDQPGRDWEAYYPTNSATCFFGAGGRFGGGLHVPGGSSIDSKCTTWNGGNIFPAGTDPSLSIECWVQFNENTNRQFLISKGNAWSSKGGYDLWYDAGKLKSAFADTSTNVMQTALDWTPSTGIWYHVAATWNAVDDTTRMFVDGMLLGSQAFPGASIINHTARKLTLGQRAISNYSGLDGIIDEVRISSVAYEFSTPPAPRRATYPWGNEFWFSFYSTSEVDSQYALDHGATGIGPYYGADQSGVLARAQNMDANISYKVRPACMEGANTRTNTYVWPDDATIVADTIAALDAVKNNEHIALWDLNPEEMRYYNAQEVHYLNLVGDTVHAHDPYGRPFMMYEQNNRTATNLSVTLPYQDICAKGMYVQTVSGGAFRHHRIWARWSMEQELGAIAAVNTNAVPWIMLWMAADAKDGEEYLITDWCRHDAYMGLIMGGKGISIWSGWRPRNTWTNDFQAYFDAYLSVADDLNGARNFAPIFLYGEEATGVTHNVTSGPVEQELIYGGETNYYPSVTYSLRRLFGLDYLFMVNSATQAVSLTFSGVPDAARTDLFSAMEYPASGGSFAITLDPYEVAGFRFDGYNVWRDNTFTVQQIADGDADENADPDFDGHTNRDEFNAGTDPNDGADFFQTNLSFSNDWKTVSFNTSSQRFYNIDLSTNLMDGSWLPMLGNEPGDGLGISMVDTNPYPAAFYRTRATRP